MAITLRLTDEEKQKLDLIGEKNKIKTYSKILKFCLAKTYEMYKDLKA